MSGHSHWAGIKHKKEAKDQKRGVVFSKLLNAISIAAKSEANPDFNPRLRTTVQKAEEANVASDKINHAIKRAREKSNSLTELFFEAYGPGGTAILIAVITDSRNRAVAEIKKILSDFGGKWAESGSVLWAFSQTANRYEPDTDKRGSWEAKFPLEINGVDKTKLAELVGALEEHDDVQRVYTNAGK